MGPQKLYVASYMERLRINERNIRLVWGNYQPKMSLDMSRYCQMLKFDTFL